MLKREKGAVLTFLVLMVISSMAIAEIAAASLSIYVDPPKASAKIGDTFTVDIEIADVSDLWAFEAKLRYNATLLEFSTIVEGSFMKDWAISQGSTTFFADDTTHYNYVMFSVFISDPIVGASGSGTLTTVTLEVKERNRDEMDDGDLVLYDVSLTDHNQNPIDGSLTITDGKFILGPGDATGDGKVDYKDLFKLASSYGAKYGEPNYNENADFKDPWYRIDDPTKAKIDYKDLFKLAGNYGTNFFTDP